MGGGFIVVASVYVRLSDGEDVRAAYGRVRFAGALPQRRRRRR